ncbi:hypothetical protein [Lacipirellula parvula]|uniref:Uncharacterized protein n=1 Tax=Lacipirellula parvula TaxID=2650471 RepID=A0A5K7X4R9_9BACT|nr:hypothetical protein [Lacipirellula parvula]BBO31548.1 hypothetical protein PLANPX_1160 [Lacipirellula parvula]
MSISYNASAPSGKQFTIAVGGTQYVSIPASAAEVILRRAGLSLREAREQLAMAKFNSHTAAVS